MNIVALDIASTSAAFCVIGTTGLSQEGSFTMTREGFESFLAAPQVREATLFAMESTGGYHLPIYHFLLNHGKKARIINPLLIKKFHDGETLRRTKTDHLDALTIARFTQSHMMSLQEDRTQMDTESKLLARRRAHNAQELAKAKTILKSDLSVAFPEILELDVYTKSLLNFLAVFGCAKDILAATDEELESALSLGRGRKSDSITIQTLKRLASGSIGVSLHGFMVKDSAKRVLACQERDKQLTEALIQLEQSLHKSDMEILTSIPGIGPVTAAQFLSEIPDITKFATYRKLIAYIGTDPGIYESGSTSRSLKISKKGNAVLRKYGYLMADGCIKHNVVFNAYYHKKRDEGFPHRKAMIATMNKLMRTVYALLTKGEKYVL